MTVPGKGNAAQEIRRLGRGSITIFELPEEGEKQSNHLAEGSVNIVKGLIRTLKSSTESNLRTEIGSHRAFQLGTVATWRRIRPNRCTRSHLQSGRFLLPRALACGCPCCQPWTGRLIVGASLPHVLSEVVNAGP